MAADRAKTATAILLLLLANRVLEAMLNDMMQQQPLAKDKQQYQADSAPARTLKSILSRVAGRFRVRQ